MAYPQVVFETTKTAAHALHRYVSTLPHARHLHLRPRTWSGPHRLGSDFAEWWLIPMRDRYGTQYGRLFIDRIWGPPGRRLPGLLRAGFTVSRGFGRQVAEMVPPSLAMTPAWFWTRFLSDSMAGIFDVPLRTVMERTDQPVTVDVALTYFDRYPGPTSSAEPPTPDDRLVFEMDRTTLTLETVHEGGQHLAPLVSSQTLRDLVLRIEGVPDLTWYWIDVHLCIKAWFSDADAQSGWDATDLWTKALAPWLPWVH